MRPIPKHEALLRALIDGLALEAAIDGEVFRVVPGYTRYAVGRSGSVFSSVRSGRFLRPTVSPQGYPYVSLMADGRPHKELIHRLVASAFVPNPDGMPVVNHINGVKSDPRAENLEWTTFAANNDHARDTGLARSFGTTHYAARLDDDRVRQIRQAAAGGELHREIAARFGIARQTVTKIVGGKAWARAA